MVGEQNSHFIGKSHTVWVPRMGHDKDKTAYCIKGDYSKLTPSLHDMTICFKRKDEK